jgi:nicotinamidase-related amidase
MGPQKVQKEGNSTMKRLKKVLFWTTGSAILLVVVMLGLFFWSMSPTKGRQIEKYPAPRSALVIIDIQEDYTGPQAKKRYHDGDRIVSASNALLAQAPSKETLVIYVKNVVDNPIMHTLMGGINAPNAAGTEMDRRLIRVPGAMTFTKNRSDAFSNPELDAYLRANHVDRLLLTGLDGAYCVNATARGALNRGYNVTLFQDGIATESSKSMEKLAEGWRKAGANVKSGSDL